MPSLYRMILDLFEAVECGDIYSDDCEHISPSDTSDTCKVCFILNMKEHLSEDEAQAMQETTNRQRALIYQLFDGYLNGDWQSYEEYL